MGEDWSREEVEATVASYFDMLDSQLRGLAYSKTAHRRQLAALLQMRSDGAIERKHQNISAVLMDLGFPCIAGYKPLRNYQRLLHDTVAGHFENHQSLVELVRVQVDQPAVVPVVDDILGALVDAPKPDPLDRRQAGLRIREQPSTRSGVDYLAREAHNRSLGAAGEEFVVRFEIARLLAARRETLASRVERVSVTRGDSIGFDVLSFDTSGRERFIEVKTTAYGRLTPFFVTKNEVSVSDEADDGYFLYRAFEFRHRPRLFTKQGPLQHSFDLNPSQYLARVV